MGTGVTSDSASGKRDVRKSTVVSERDEMIEIDERAEMIPLASGGVGR